MKNGTWIKTTLIAAAWPDISSLLVAPEVMQEVDEDMYADLQRVIPFAANKAPTIKLCEEGIFVCNEVNCAEVTGYEFPLSYFRAEPLSDVIKIAKEINFSSYPKPCYFTAEHLVGVIIGCVP